MRSWPDPGTKAGLGRVERERTGGEVGSGRVRKRAFMVAIVRKVFGYMLDIDCDGCLTSTETLNLYLLVEALFVMTNGCVMMNKSCRVVVPFSALDMAWHSRCSRHTSPQIRKFIHKEIR